MSRELHEELGGEMAALDKLGPAEQARLLELIRATRKRQKGRMGDAAISLGENVLKQLIANVERENSTAVLAAVAANMSAAGRRKAAALFTF